VANSDLCKKVAGVIADYRKGEIAAPDEAHVARWVDQFPQAVRDPILAEMSYILERTYARKAAVNGFIKALVTNKELAGESPGTFWKGVRFLRLQQVGQSQNDMLALFDKALRDAFGFGIEDCSTGQPQMGVYPLGIRESGGLAMLT